MSAASEPFIVMAPLLGALAGAVPGDGAATPADPALVARVVRLFVVVSSLLGAFLLLVVLTTYVRRHRVARASRRSAAARADGALADAWAEAGRRAEPYRSKLEGEQPDDADGDDGDDGPGDDSDATERGR